MQVPVWQPTAAELAQVAAAKPPRKGILRNKSPPPQEASQPAMSFAAVPAEDDTSDECRSAKSTPRSASLPRRSRGGASRAPTFSGIVDEKDPSSRAKSAKVLGEICSPMARVLSKHMRWESGGGTPTASSSKRAARSGSQSPAATKTPKRGSKEKPATPTKKAAAKPKPRAQGDGARQLVLVGLDASRVSLAGMYTEGGKFRGKSYYTKNEPTSDGVEVYCAELVPQQWYVTGDLVKAVRAMKPTGGRAAYPAGYLTGNGRTPEEVTQWFGAGGPEGNQWILLPHAQFLPLQASAESGPRAAPRRGEDQLVSLPRAELTKMWERINAIEAASPGRPKAGVVRRAKQEPSTPSAGGRGRGRPPKQAPKASAASGPRLSKAASAAAKQRASAAKSKAKAAAKARAKAASGRGRGAARTPGTPKGSRPPSSPRPSGARTPTSPKRPGSPRPRVATPKRRRST